MSASTPLVTGVGGAVGCALLPAANQLFYVSFDGNIGAIDLTAGTADIVGTGYSQLEGIVIASDGSTAFVTERGGDLLQVDLANADRTNATVVTSGMTAPHQPVLDEANGLVYLVEFASPGRLLAVDIGSGAVTPVCDALDHPVGLAVATTANRAYVSEQPAGGGGRLSEVDLSSGTVTPLVNGLEAPFFLTWDADEDGTVLLAERDPANRILRIDITSSPAVVNVVADGVATRPSSVASLDAEHLIVCSDAEIDEVEVTVPVVTDFSPMSGHGGDLLEIEGIRFGATRTENQVRVGGRDALVIDASPTQLRVVTDPATETGPVEVTVGGETGTSTHDFIVLPYPGENEDGPPIAFAGEGFGQAGDQPSTGTLRVVVALLAPHDGVPADPAAARTAATNAWNTVHTYYDQASYSRLDVQVDTTASWHTLTGNTSDYITFSGTSESPNVKSAALPRVWAEGAKAVQDDGLTLNTYVVMACVIFLNGQFIRAWGGFSQQNFQFNGTDVNGNPVNINITANHDINLLAIQESANWGRFAHELGHNLVSSPLSGVLGEDVYASDLIDPSTATAEEFEIMGDHDHHPLFSAYHMEKLGYYNSGNIRELQWDRNANSFDLDLVAHGLTENTAGGRYHLAKIRVAEGLYYYVEVRQRPDGTAQVFDDNIPLGSAPHQGGVVVTKVLTDTVNENQQLRFITLLHDPVVLKQGDEATDPARDLTISVLNDGVANRPLVSRVRIAWAQGIADDPNGAFNLHIDPWDGSYQTPDIWVDRQPFGSFDQTLDSQGRPQGNGDKPRPNEINHLWARIHCDGTVGADNVRVTFYAVDPPGVGDNGNWAPLQTKVIPNVAANGFVDVDVNWTPIVGEHTCLRAFAEHQFGEITGGDNWAQENVFDFEAPAHSVPEPVTLRFAVRNPRPERVRAMLAVRSVPRGYSIQVPHSWVMVDPGGERLLDLTVIPTLDYAQYKKREVRTAPVRLSGGLPHSYTETLAGSNPSSRLFPLGGVTARVTPKQGVRLKLWEDPESKKAGESRKGAIVILDGAMEPALANQVVRVELHGRTRWTEYREVQTNAQGHFRAVFQLRREDRLMKARASTINAHEAAATDSNRVTIRR